MYVVSFLFMHIIDAVKGKMNIAGRSRVLLQNNLFRKYLDYSEKAHGKLTSSELALTIIRGTDLLTENGYMKSLALVQMFTKMIVVVLFTYANHMDMVGPLVFYCFITVVWVLLRIDHFRKLGGVVIQKENAAVKSVQDLTITFRVIADYWQRPKVAERFSHRVADIDNAKVPLDLEELNSGYAPQWFSLILTVFYMVTFSPQVLAGSVSIGSFTAMLRIINSLGAEFKLIYSTSVIITRTIGALAKITMALNEETELRKTRGMVKEAMRIMDEKRGELIRPSVRAGSSSQDPTDTMIDIQITDIRFSYLQPSDAMDSWLISTGLFAFKQGSLVLIYGDHGSGKETFLKLLAGILTPQEGHIFFPPHLRVLNVTKDPIIVEGTLMENLCFGCFGEDEISRATFILKNLRLVKILDMLKMEEEQQWANKLSFTDLAFINLVRAFVSNPNVLVMSRPTVHFNKSSARLVLQSLKEFVEKKGLAMGRRADNARPRTCFFTAGSADVAESYAHVTFALQEGWLKEVSK
eukprot:TRINITY_DN22463_c0_g1_i1.p1 TRINITY_DN22463_c0_g1~~TRINITY_DN22463_c0_g1_i1.p1  ORF type:complete len:542 (+),score=53.49 TRINITY_DN22463_c0_g1_i1:56-1627(+)